MSATPYQRAKEEARTTLRRAVVEGAIRILETEGHTELSVRRVAAEIGASTRVLYTAFGDRAGLIEALATEGFDRLTEQLRAAPARSDPSARLVGLAHAYLAFAREQPTFFALMFGAPFAEVFPTKQSRTIARASLEPLIEAVAYARTHSLLDAGDPVTTARTMWSAMHGPAHLEAYGWLTRHETDQHVEDLVRAMLEDEDATH